MKKTQILMALGVLFCLAAAGQAAETQLPVLKTRPRTIAVFKNGFGFFTRDGEVRLADGWAVTDHIPQASLGTLWIGVLDREARLEEVVGFQEDQSLERPALSLADLFKANIGKKVAVTYDAKVIEGRIKGVPSSVPSPTETGVDLEEQRAALNQPVEGAIVILDTDGGDLVLNKAQVTKLQFLEAPVLRYKGRETVKRMKFKVSSAKDSARVGLFYLQRGISWTPAYLLDMLDDYKIRMTMQAMVVNDCEDLDGTELQFVVGYPNFAFSGVLSPMAQTQSLLQFLNALSAQSRRSDFSSPLSNIAMQRVAPMEEDAGLDIAGFPSFAASGLEGTSEEDLYFYTRKNVNLGKGQRGLYNIFAETIDYAPIYEWTVPDTSNVDSQGDVHSVEPQKKWEQVWHSLKLKNSTSNPWTTAPALVVRQGKPIAQDILDYTSKDSSVNLKLTIASDVRTGRQEFEVARQRDVTIYRHSYDLVTVQGELKLKNNKDKPITMSVKKTLTGEGLEASHQGKVQKLAEGLELRAVNPNSRITWEIPLKAHEETVLTYKYKVYISR